MRSGAEVLIAQPDNLPTEGKTRRNERASDLLELCDQLHHGLDGAEIEGLRYINDWTEFWKREQEARNRIKKDRLPASSQGKQKFCFKEA